MIIAAVGTGFAAMNGAFGQTTAEPGASVFISPAGSDAGTCSRSAPCLSFDRAYAVARPGAVVEVAAGTYGEQVIQSQQNRTGARVVFRPAANAPVGIAGVEIHGSHIEFRDMQINTWLSLESASDLVFRDIVNRGFWINGSDNVTITGGSVGPGIDSHSIIGAAYLSPKPPTNIVIERVFFHDWTRTSADVHTECLQILGGANVTIRRSRFQNCAVMDIFVSHYGSDPPTRAVTIENNFLAAPIDGGFYSILSGSWDSLLIRNNSALAPIIIEPQPGPGTNMKMVGNVAPLQSWGCDSRVVYRFNVWQGARCGPTDRDAAAAFVNAATLDLRLKPKAPAIGRGDPNDFPRVDIYGRPRPQGARPDAGAYEVLVKVKAKPQTKRPKPKRR
jgi:hypothetical protein